jgi:hypothetical protein
MSQKPTVVVKKDFNGYFEKLVNSWLDVAVSSGYSFKHHTIVVNAGPYRAVAVTVEDTDNPGEVMVDFYSGLRAGFGELSRMDVAGIIDML